MDRYEDPYEHGGTAYDSVTSGRFCCALSVALWFYSRVRIASHRNPVTQSLTVLTAN